MVSHEEEREFLAFVADSPHPSRDHSSAVLLAYVQNLISGMQTRSV
jgi:hypothetical protein